MLARMEYVGWMFPGSISVVPHVVFGGIVQLAYTTIFGLA